MALISVQTSGGIKHIDYDAMARTAIVYYTAGSAEYFYNVSWTEFSTIAAAANPLATLLATTSTKRSTKGGHG